MADGDFDEAFPRLFQLAYQVSYRVLGSRPAAEDVAQETLTRALTRWRRVEDHAPAWVATVSLRLAIDATRQQARHPSQSLGEVPAAADDLERRLDLHAALRRLPKRQQQALACRYLADLPDEESARLLRLSPGTVKQHAARGLKALRASGLSPHEGTGHA